MIKKRPISRKNTRDKLLEKAIQVFAQRGSQQTTIADIAKAANIAQGTIYIYFQSKEELLGECIQKIINPEIEAIIDATKGIEDTMDRLYEFFVQHVRLVKQKPYVARFLTVEARHNEDFYATRPDYSPLKRYLDWVENIAEMAIRDKRIRPLDTKAFALLIVGVMDLTLAQWLSHPDTMDIAKIAESVRDIIRHGTLHSPEPK
ncbi:MAG: TetR/AcrR family transcriptional regulator [Candidatus Cloacimonadaceae bacterium]|nr:TetR/AcrR family transcriptional regulator [Candidatus Cloacimonadota bacterium]MDY0127950.1 TetR/AcrR family transcriptional regulator [Candidatus Cloacimonadaceae bacterium]MCB5255152.1 TetR/AcrR family transcriptional regulator [Candidatus Cloacimonadota bacterium]MCK9179183.1 TetR/AcrR family transcriptional regulator [Candidatus Cloacimonadota bacterium]MCK9242393.1 TetR/AcrR family transcriptional regulator [Candidatus Cloacimonadota bacterium]